MTKLCLSLGLLISVSSMNLQASQTPIELTVSPEQCVALHKGQTCYQNVLFKWQTPDVGRYCLTESKSHQKIICWDGQAMKQYQYDFEGISTTLYSLIRLDSEEPLAEIKVVVTWVYKAPKQSQSGWRLF
ncbi:DUF3019 domain-containing protein [Shewanella sp. cp20]|uniref:DUF3019 domain-containing protein n=1 Tax=Shewanella sp. cp20 TaxID=1521167 RepID=UPI0005A12A8A|nr:DUF3019 domain-containing protein [Shewanella sp. cp20]KIO38285.1 hypothetical protein DB48_01690 [Shewanella sp. cp20]